MRPRNARTRATTPQVEGTCSGQHGYIVCVTGVNDISKGKIRSDGSGLATFKVGKWSYLQQSGPGACRWQLPPSIAAVSKGRRLASRAAVSISAEAAAPLPCTPGLLWLRNLPAVQGRGARLHRDQREQGA